MRCRKMCFTVISYKAQLLLLAERVSSEEQEIFDTPTESKNAEVIGALAVILVAAEIAFMLLLDANHLKQACSMFKNKNCRGRKKKEDQRRRTASSERYAHAASTAAAAPPAQPVLLHVPAPTPARAHSPSAIRPRLNSTNAVTSFRSSGYARNGIARAPAARPDVYGPFAHGGAGGAALFAVASTPFHIAIAMGLIRGSTDTATIGASDADAESDTETEDMCADAGALSQNITALSLFFVLHDMYEL